MGINLCKRQDYRTNRIPEITIGNLILWTCGNHQEDSRGKNRLVAEYLQRHRRQSQKLYSLIIIW